MNRVYSYSYGNAPIPREWINPVTGIRSISRLELVCTRIDGRDTRLSFNIPPDDSPTQDMEDYIEAVIMPLKITLQFLEVTNYARGRQMELTFPCILNHNDN